MKRLKSCRRKSKNSWSETKKQASKCNAGQANKPQASGENSEKVWITGKNTPAKASKRVLQAEKGLTIMIFLNFYEYSLT
ncbi:hypothetical protein [Treponema phagedenis]|uniref:hypothetical protein n=1 Tax=Treponema phagedenis TaxID=162 RepID=UPI002090BD7D|nr:hypothetical protein [Treponema phagedenis]